MIAAQLIHETNCLPSAELAKVVHHTKKFAEVRQLSPDELGVLIDQFVEATNPQQVERLRENITQGFYGRQLRCRKFVAASVGLGDTHFSHPDDSWMSRAANRAAFFPSPPRHRRTFKNAA